MGGTIKQPYKNVGIQLKEWILSEINNSLNNLTKALPCKVITNNGQTVDVQVTVNIGMSLSNVKKVPIAKTRYLNLPIKAGDLGLLIPSDYLFNSLAITNNASIPAPKPATAISGYIFIPFTNYAQDYAGSNVNNNTKLFSQNGASNIEITNSDIKLKTNEEILWSHLKTYLDNWQLNYNANITATNANNATIIAAFATLGKTIVLGPSTPYNGSYR